MIKVRRGREQMVHGNAPALRRVAQLLDEYEQIWIHRADRIADLAIEDADHTDQADHANRGGAETSRIEGDRT